jgi:HNH endonuclease
MGTVQQESTLFGPPPTASTPLRSRLGVGESELPVDDATVDRFLAKCAPADDQGHRWWLGAIDGGADHSGGYGRFQAGSGDTLVTTTAHRYAWTLEHGPIPPGLVVRHRCDEPLCTAAQDLVVGTYADNRWDAIARPYRAADLDLRGSAGRSRAIREAVLRVLASDDANAAAIGAAARAAMLAGDPNRDQLTLWSVADAR